MTKEKIEKFLKEAKEVTCPKCGQVYMTVEKDLTCYVCHTNIKHGAVFN
jgi:Zn finger protein HypA/HybF involved in hydrogenase expression